MDKQTFVSFLALLMCSDPWPTDEPHQSRLIAWADEHARSVGYADWIDAYHKLG